VRTRPIHALLAAGRLPRIALACALAMPLTVYSQPVSEQAIKAVLYFKLPQFVYLPVERSQNPEILCAMGGHGIVAAFEKVARSQADARPASFQVVNSIGEASRCSFLFLSRAEAAGYDSILQRLASGVVTVSDIAGFARAGGMIEFAQSADRNSVQILINRKAARAQGIEFNAQLLRLARIVEP
jgi:hypothetical protein